MHHLDVMPRARPQIATQGSPFTFAAMSQQLLHAGIGFGLAARHDARPQRALLAGDADAEEVDAVLRERGGAALGVPVPRVAAVDDDVARLRAASTGRSPHRPPLRFHHQEHAARRLDGVGEGLHVVG